MKRFLQAERSRSESKKTRDDHDSSSVDDDPLQPVSQARTGKRSDLWDYFEDEPKKRLTESQKASMTPAEIKAHNETWYAVCKVYLDSEKTRFCNQKIKRNQGNTKGMRGHLQLHKKEFAEYMKKKSKTIVDDAQGSLAVLDSYKEYGAAQDVARDILNKPPLTRKGPETLPIDTYFQSHRELEPWKPNSTRQRRADLDLMLMIARCGLPFAIVDQPGFKECVYHVSINDHSQFVTTLLRLRIKNLVLVVGVISN